MALLDLNPAMTLAAEWARTGKDQQHTCRGERQSKPFFVPESTKEGVGYRAARIRTNSSQSQKARMLCRGWEHPPMVIWQGMDIFGFLHQTWRGTSVQQRFSGSKHQKAVCTQIQNDLFKNICQKFLSLGQLCIEQRFSFSSVHP